MNRKKTVSTIFEDNNFADFLFSELFPPLINLSKKPVFEKSEIINQYFIEYSGDQPDSTDRLILYIFLKFSIKEKNKKIKINSLNSILKDCGLSSGSSNYKRLIKSCVKWKGATICIENNLLNEKIIFSIFDFFLYARNTRVLSLTVNDIFYNYVSNSKIVFFLNSDENYFFTRPLSRRLYEILKKNITKYNELAYELKDLSSKIKLKQKFPSQIKQSIFAVVNEINQKSDLKIKLETYKRTDKKIIFKFINNNLLTKKKERAEKMRDKNLIGILSKYSGKQENLINLMQEVQKTFNYISPTNLKILCNYVGVSFSHGYSVATFYKSFKLEPQGENDIKVCLGTACHLRGGKRLMEGLERILGVKPGQTTKDLKFTYNSVNCVGACAIAPVVVINEEYKPNITVKKLEKELKTIANF